MDNIQMQFAIAGIINGLVQLIILVASIIILVKKKSTATVFLCVGSLLNIIGFVGGYIYNAIAAQNGTEAILNAQVTLHFFNAFSIFIFGVGLLLLALNHFGKHSTDRLN
ncbi:hypothetical protein FPF71_15890 [Algibacter amylolyticus]|uniref:DUF420 domain-containing protein n=1 Tax=Algibacter amylolyticus TaxID=1608400 RepID=A0A5M7AX43_9FLAO|nr:hypothetical protein [Algibacter amylolyticus]KAA5821986.1 hypothetical protein F2B50_15890 [Algibacter amylolyticus]MBB5269212.1 hypothetical protein [Algibacter amylolyticus]TSJ73270.1 hypothetical protein FPF71_15890 [Algibacter amylolyticus]